MSGDNNSISYIVPTLNEVGNIKAVIQLISQVQSELHSDYEIIFCDDESTDGTVDLISNLIQSDERISLVAVPERKGLGNALIHGISRAKYQFSIFLDADCSVSSIDLCRLIRMKSIDEMVIGSRYCKGGETVGAPYFKVWASKILNRLVALYLGLPLYDLSHSLRIIPSELNCRSVKNLTHPGFFWELSQIAFQSGIMIREVPIMFTERTIGTSKNNSLVMLRSVLRTVRTIKNNNG